ncbi:Protein CHROMATIN REMODELING 19 [Dionaea muscipula]
MKRAFEEISDDEWDHHHDFKPSRILNSNPQPPPAPIESFAYQPLKPPIIDLTEEDLEDSDADVHPRSNAANRGRRFVVDDEDDDGDEDDEVDVRKDEAIQVKWEDDDDAEFEWDTKTLVEVEEEEEEAQEGEEDVVCRALRRCGKISEELRRELYGSSSAACDRYAEVDASSVRIVTQDDIFAACGAEDSDFCPLLKPYQLVGVNFLLLLYKKKIGGAILADEMGLGKTIQAITYLTLLKYLENDPGPHLVVCPASVLENWEREVAKWCPSFSVLQYHGAAQSTYSEELTAMSKAGLPPPFNVLLVSYSLFERHSGQQKDNRKILKGWRWSCVVMDEAHALKNKNSYRWKNLMSVARNANQRLMLTGTPLQNDLHELWSLLELIMPDIFATENVDLKKLLSASERDLIARMKSILGPFILRRLKSDVMQQLAPKIQRVEYVYMEKEQEDAYKEAIEEYRRVSLTRLRKNTEVDPDCIARFLPRRQISNYFVQFRKIANHPLLVRRIYNDEDVIRFANKLHPKGVFGFECTMDRVIDEIKTYSDFCIHRLLFDYGIEDRKGILPDKQVMASAKCQALAKLLPFLKQSGHRVLIFSQWTSMLDILEWALDVIGVTYRRLDGSTHVTERQTIVDTFNNDGTIFACLLSTRAGGQGLNLIGADTVIIHDLDFNPQIDRQAEDRCHRIGQTKSVTIYRLVTKDTVDESVHEIAKRKLVLDAAVLEYGDDVGKEGDTSEKTMGEILSAILLG